MLAEFLGARTVCVLSSLCLAYNELHDRGLAALSGALDEGSLLKALDVSFNGIRDVAPLAAVLKRNRSLTSLDLGMNAIEDASQLALSLRSNDTLTWCSLLWNAFDDTKQLAAVAANSDGSRLTLCGLADGQTEVSFPRERLRTVDGVLITRELAQHSRLQAVDLSHNDLGPPAATALASALPACRALARLNVEDNWLSGARIKFGMVVGTRDPSGLAALASALSSAPSLTQLNIANNGIDAHDARVLGEAVAGPGGSKLRGLHVGSGACQLPVQRLRGRDEAGTTAAQSGVLDLSPMRLDDYDCVVVCTALVVCPKITQLVLRDSAIGVIGCLALGDAVAAGGALTRLDLRGEMMMQNGSGKRELGAALLACPPSPLAFLSCDAWSLGPDMISIDLSGKGLAEGDCVLLAGWGGGVGVESRE